MCAVEEKIRENRRFTITSLSLHFPEISLLLLHEIVSDKLTFLKFCARWVPKVLTEEHKLKRQASLLEVLTQYIEEGENFLSHVVTGNETLVSQEAPKSKQQSMECCHTSSPTKTKFNQTTSTQIMCTVFWVRKGVLLVDFLPQDFPVNAGVCCDTLKKFCHVIQNKRRGMLGWGVLMIHGNTHPHAATVTQNLTTTFGWEQFDHPPPYSPDLAPADCHLFLHLKSFVAGTWFHDDEVKEAVTTCFPSQAASFCDEGVQNWCNAMTSASTMVETMSKSSVRCVQYIKWQYTSFVIYSFFFFFLIAHRNLLSG